ncbi:MAG: methionine biosynthesis protein MetW, partial [Candidatus Hydrogenedentes bacterium]|nr:methionine biosynthesis protein MetW [Candidatus Hydrogenedentota bacterium]
SEESMHEKFGRELRSSDKYRYDLEKEFSVETYLDYQGQTFVERFDANSYLYITKAMDYFDLTKDFGSLKNAFAKTDSRIFVIAFSSDWLFTVRQSEMVVDALSANNKDVTFCNVDSPYGHDAFLLEPEVLGRLIGGFLVSASGAPVIPEVEDLEPYSEKPAVETAWRRQRVDYERIENLVPSDSAVLDLGCGRGTLMSRLVSKKNVQARGVEVYQGAICECIERGLEVIDLDLETELSTFANKSYDYVVLSQTLQTLRRPGVVLEEMLRIGRYGIVSFPNFGYWQLWLQMFLRGRAPVSEHLPFAWYDTPNLHYLTIRDFDVYCRDNHIRVHKRIAMLPQRRSPVRWWPNLRAEEVIFVISKD